MHAATRENEKERDREREREGHGETEREDLEGGGFLVLLVMRAETNQRLTNEINIIFRGSHAKVRPRETGRGSGISSEAVGKSHPSFQPWQRGLTLINLALTRKVGNGA